MSAVFTVFLKHLHVGIFVSKSAVSSFIKDAFQAEGGQVLVCITFQTTLFDGLTKIKKKNTVNPMQALFDTLGKRLFKVRIDIPHLAYCLILTANLFRKLSESGRIIYLECHHLVKESLLF